MAHLFFHRLLKTKSFHPKFACLLLLPFFVLMASPSLAQRGKLNTIIIDPGHGGKYTGAHANYKGTLGSKEKDIVLGISMKLVAELKKRLPEVKVIPTRTTDVSMSVHEKAKFANDHHGDLFISIHADAVVLKTGYKIVNHRRKYYKIPSDRHGTSTLILLARQSSDKVEALEDSDMMYIMGNEDSLKIDYNSPELKASAMLYSQKYFRRSYQLAKNVQEEVAKAGRKDLGVWQRTEGLWVLHATQMPAILIETGFIVNYDDERYLNSEKGQQEIAEMITRAVLKYKDQIEGRIDGTVHND